MNQTIQVDLKNLRFTKDEETIMEEIKALGVGLRPVNDPFFDEGDKVCGMYVRLGIVDVDDEALCHEVMKTFVCEIPNCLMEFDNLLNYELHYNSCHRYSCSECRKQLPSPHILDLHISESHDSFFMALAERKPMYRCFVESCSVVSSNAKDRKSHCIEVHKYPHDFKFYFSNRKTSPKAKNKKKTEKTEVEVNEAKPVARYSFTFGHRKTPKTFKQSKGKSEKPIEMHELMETLPAIPSKSTEHQ